MFVAAFAAEAVLYSLLGKTAIKWLCPLILPNV